MPVTAKELLVEGKLDSEVLSPAIKTLAVPPLVTRGGSKGSLRPKARDLRQAKVPISAWYLRDRDFDFDPVTNASAPTEDARYGGPQGPVLGWRWCRHNIECYLLDPLIVQAATGLNDRTYTGALVDAARRIHHYSAARWTIGVARRCLQPLVKELPTRPSSFQSDYRIPTDLSKGACARWALERCGNFRDKVDMLLAESVIEAAFAEREAHLAGLTTAEEVLTWNCGRDLATALDPRLFPRPISNPTDFVERVLATWVHDNPTKALPLLPEWGALLSLLS